MRWVELRLRCRVKFAERTRDGRLRAPVFSALLDDDAPESRSRVTLTNPDKVFFPAEGLTKGDCSRTTGRRRRWWCRISGDRPFTMLRYPDGIEGKSFFQKDAPDHMPD